MMFKIESEKIYKFIYEDELGYRAEKKTILLVACNSVDAVKKFNRMTNNKAFNIIEFTEIVHKAEGCL